ncbi:MAG: TolC family protein [Kordiimonas sp.]
MRSSIRSMMTGLGVMGVLAGCSAPPVPQSTNDLPFSVPNQWKAGEGNSRAETTSASTGWFLVFNSSVLNSFIEEAFENNPNLQIVKQRLEAAGIDRNRIVSSFGPQGVISSDALTRGRMSGVRNTSGNQAIFQLDMSWELDLWGRQKALSREARWRQKSAENAFEFERFSLAAMVARLWLNIVEHKQMLNIQQKAILVWNNQYASALSRYQKGSLSINDVHTIMSALASSQAQLEKLERTLGMNIRALKVVLGKYPDKTGMGFVESILPPAPVFPRADAPAELLMKRPDVTAVRAELEAKDAATVAAHLAMYPSLKLSLLPRFLSGSLTGLNGNSSQIDASAGFAVPLFNRRTLTATRDKAALEAKQAFGRYVQTVLQAYQEVEQALDNEALINNEWRAQKQAHEAANAATSLNARDYERGLIPLGDYLASQNRALELEQSIIALEALRLRNWVSLQLALGNPVSAQPTNTKNNT